MLVQGLFEWVWFGSSNKLVFCIGCGRKSNRSHFGDRKSKLYSTHNVGLHAPSPKPETGPEGCLGHWVDVHPFLRKLEALRTLLGQQELWLEGSGKLLQLYSCGGADQSVCHDVSKNSSLTWLLKRQNSCPVSIPPHLPRPQKQNCRKAGFTGLVYMPALPLLTAAQFSQMHHGQL